MDNFNSEIIDFLDESLSDEYLDEQINTTRSLKHLLILFNLRKRRILSGKSKKINFPMHTIYEQESDNLYLQSDVLKTVLSITENIEEKVKQVITYLNSQLCQIDVSFNINIARKVSLLLNDLVLICKSENITYIFHDNICTQDVNTYLLHGIFSQNSLRMNILSSVLPNYFTILSELNQFNFLHNCFLQCKVAHNLEVLCYMFNYTEKKVLQRHYNNILFSNDFWQYLADCISCDSYEQRKQSTHILKNLVKVFCDNATLDRQITYLQTINTHHVVTEIVWQHFFIILEASNEKQLHLIWPALTLLDSLKHINVIWQTCVYKRLLMHMQNAVIYSVATHILHENIFFPLLNKTLLSAINKNEYMDYCINMFKAMPKFCNYLEMEQFCSFLDNILQITWCPTAAWCLISYTFTETLIKVIPFKYFHPIYTILKQLPHVYIRNASISVFFNYFLRNYNWKGNFNDAVKLLHVVKDYNTDLFMVNVTKNIDSESLNITMSEIKENIDLKHLEILIQIIKIIKHEKSIKSVLESVNIVDEKVLLVIYINLYELCEIRDIERFALRQITEIDEDSTEAFLSLIKKLLKSQNFSEIMYSKALLILCQSSEYNLSTLRIALYILLNSFKMDGTIKSIIKDLKYTFFDCGKTDDNVCMMFLELYFLVEEYPEISFLQYILHDQSDVVISSMFKYLSAFKFCQNYVDIVYFIEKSLEVLPNLTKSRHFKNIVVNYIDCIFSISFLEILYDVDKLNIVTSTTNYFLSLSETFPIVDYYLSLRIREIILLPTFSNKFVCILIPIIEELLLKGMIIKKDDRVEYCICQKIFETTADQRENPNFIKISARMAALEVMLLVITRNSEHADAFTAGLIKKYEMYFNKRYFPDSQIHLQKLRIIQALLSIHPFIDNQKQPLINLIVESFCKEIHQPCVKQLMQWLLISLMKDHDNYFDLIKAKIDATSKTQPSSIVAFIVILLHLTLCKAESYWFSTIEALIPWCMGAHFKLRVYSQAAIKKLLEEAKHKCYNNFLTKYSFLEKSIVSVIEASGQAFCDTLKSDELFFSVFKSEENHSIETIYVDIPKLNGVTRTEWENILQYKFISHEIMNVLNENRLFSDSVRVSIENNKKEKPTENKSEMTYNIQRKITPWKSLVEPEENSKQTSDFILIASLIDKSTNLGGLSRTCEVFGVKQLVLNDIKILQDKDFKSLSMSSEEWVNALEVKVSNLKKFIIETRDKGYSVIGAEQTSDSISLHKYKFDKKTALVLGNEKEGIPPDIIPILDRCIEIPQFGMVRSLNVHVAGATFIWEYAKQHLLE